MTKAEVLSAFREAVSEEFASIPDSDKEFELNFSEKFEKKMQKLIKSEKRSYYRLINSGAKKALLVAVIVAMMTASLFSVGAVRDAVGEFFVEVFDNYFTMQSYEAEIDKIEYVYKFSEVPEGFAVTNQFSSDNLILTTYENDRGDRLELTQNLSHGSERHIDYERGEISDWEIGNRKIKLYANELKTSPEMMAFWIQNDYELMLTYNGKISKEKLLEYIQLIK